MRSSLLRGLGIVALIPVILFAGKLVPVDRIDPKVEMPALMKITEAMEDTAQTIFPEFLGYTQHTIGMTYYDMQHNRTVGRNIALDDEGGLHFSWMRSPNALLNSRNIYYNYIDPMGNQLAGYEETGLRADYALFKSGYTTIDVHGCTPYIAYHQSNSAADDYHAQVVWDAASIESECGFHGGFSEATPDPQDVPFPECPDEISDMLDIWPVISVSEYDGDVHIVTTTSNGELPDTVDCGGVDIPVKSYAMYHHANVDYSGSSSMGFEDPGVVLHEEGEISSDIATASTRDEVAVAFIHQGEYECGWVDARNIVLMRSSDDGVSWDTTYITDNGPDFREDPLDTFFYGLYFLDIDSASTPWDSTVFWGVDTFVLFTRPYGGLNVFYDNDDNVHVIWTESTNSPDSCRGDIATFYAKSTINHWSEETGEESLVTDAFPARGAPWPGGDNDNPRYFYSSYAPNTAVGPDGTLYCIWQQTYGELWWWYAMAEEDSLDIVYYDRSTEGFANNEIFLSYSEDNGATWVGPLDVSNTYTPLCDHANCRSELDPTIAKKADDFIHLVWIDDQDAGLGIQEYGEITENPVKYAKIPTDIVRECADAMDMVTHHLEPIYPDSTIQHPFNPDSILSGVKENHPNAPTGFDLHQNYPNPFNATTMLSFDIIEAGNYILELYDISGKLVSVVHNGELGRGNHNLVWNAVDEKGKKIPSGTYLFRLRDEKGNYTTRTMTLVK